MDVVTMIILENQLEIPLDVLRFLNEFLREELNDNNFKIAIKLWFENRELCIIRFGHISNWKTGKVTNMSCAFSDRTEFNEDISRWNVSNVKNMSSMFHNANSFNSDLSNWNVSNVNSMCFMFCNATFFNSNLSKWNVTNLKNMAFMFCNAISFNTERNAIKIC